MAHLYLPRAGWLPTLPLRAGWLFSWPCAAEECAAWLLPAESSNGRFSSDANICEYDGARSDSSSVVVAMPSYSSAALIARRHYAANAKAPAGRTPCGGLQFAGREHTDPVHARKAILGATFSAVAACSHSAVRRCALRDNHPRMRPLHTSGSSTLPGPGRWFGRPGRGRVVATTYEGL